MTLPKSIEIEIEEGEIRKDLIEILESMETIRNEELTENNIGEEKKDEYLHLSLFENNKKTEDLIYTK
ncbi:hypothetical protein ACFL1H_07345 [Nanoarchaeota archaeon]